LGLGKKYFNHVEVHDEIRIIIYLSGSFRDTTSVVIGEIN
jgi:hypothetical protein